MNNSTDSMVRGALPLVWLAMIASTPLLYSLPANDPTWGGLIATFRQWHAPLPAIFILTVLTCLHKLPSKRETIAATVGGIVGSGALIAVAAVAGTHDAAWLLIVALFIVVPLTSFLFRRLMFRGVE